MDKLYLDRNEGIILEDTEIERYGAKEITLEEMILTNKNLVFVYDYKAGFFSKTEKKIDKLPLENIKVINGQAQATRIDHDDYGCVMQLVYTNGTKEFFKFYDEKKDIPKWINAINTAVTGNETPIVEEKQGIFASAKKGFLSFAQKGQESDAISKKAPKKENSEKKSASTGNGGTHIFCTNCGEKLLAGAKFCGSCGTPISQTTPASNQRQQEFVGKVYKCPNCGSVITPSTLVCPDCGMRISKTQDTNALRVFQEKMMELESEKSGFGIKHLGNTKRKVALIENYPIPDSVDEIVEFMTYTQEMFNESDYADFAIAWYKKAKQLYAKAKLSFSGDSAFVEVEKMYINVRKKYLENFNE